MTRVEACGTDIRAWGMGDGIRRILKEDQIWECLPDRWPIRHVSDEVGENETFGLRGDNLLEVFDGWDIGIQTYITEHGLET